MQAALGLLAVGSVATPASAIEVHGVIAEVDVSPPKVDGAPVEVVLGVFVSEILHIDEGENAYETKGYLTMSWVDPRLAFAAPADQFELSSEPAQRVYLQHDAELLLEQIWWPDIEFVNNVRDSDPADEEVIVSSDGRIEFRERFVETLATTFEMRKFPFDRQRLLMELQPFAWSSRDVVLKQDEEIFGFSDEFALAGWHITDVDVEVQSHQEKYEGVPFSQLTVSIAVKRDPGFFVWKFLVPLTIVMLMIASSLWIPADQIKDRVAATLTGVLTSAAYGFTISRYLPDHVYDTYLESVIIASLLYAALLTMIHVLNFRLHVGSRRGLSERVDRAARVLFPLGFFATLFALGAWYGL